MKSNLSFLILLLLTGFMCQATRTCKPDPCDSCNSEQICVAGKCETSHGTSPVPPTTKPVPTTTKPVPTTTKQVSSTTNPPVDNRRCGSNAVCLGTCSCEHGYQGDPLVGCTAISASTTVNPSPTPSTTRSTPKPDTEGPTTSSTPKPDTEGPTTSSTTKPPAGETAVEKLMNKQDWDQLFPNRWHESSLWHQYYTPSQPWYYNQMEVDYYSFDNFVAAVKTMADSGYGNFLNEPGTTDEDRKRELCAFLGNAAHETGEGENGLFYREEIHYERTQWAMEGGYYSVGSRSDYRMGTKPVLFRNTSKLSGQQRFKTASYHGRGPMQLSWGYNYGDFSKAVFGNPQVLLENPDRLLDEPRLGISAAIWFWMTQPDWKPQNNCHKVIYKKTSTLHPWGFGRTIMAINGGLEGDSTENGPTEKDKKVTRRIKNYRRCARYFDVDVGINGEKLDTKGLWN